ncbi:MAG TPA: NgoFVII family restriction endonuclease [Smithella sp.]|jgi:superfamily II DNA or RNA helicase|nr:NgoFVII family restriction endonuclease [Smithella sp.]
MPQIFDNIEKHLLPTLSEAMGLSERADFCVGYFNLRGWRKVDSLVEKWTGGDGHCCRLLVGMQQMPQDQMRSSMCLIKDDEQIDQATAIALKRKLAQDFRDQLTIGIPTNEDEAGLRRLAAQITSHKLVVKLFLRHPLHAKLYLCFRQDPLNPKIGYLGSSNLTLAGLSKQGELNVDVLDHDACDKLAKWFEERWNDKFCVDISKELVDIINASWASPEPIPPYQIYVKMAYHLSQEARAGLTEFRIPNDFGNMLFEFQKAAVKIAAHHLNKRGGVVIGDVVGLGKTLMATALARIFEDDHGVETLIICPKNLVPMWEDYRQRYRLRAKVLSITQAQRELPDLRRFRLVLIDESHNLRNREGRRYHAIAEYIAANDSRVILLSATPYNKTYLDLSNQLRLFIDEKKDIGIRPEKLLRELGETEFIRRHQCPVRSLAAFDKSEYADDWRDLMRLYLVRRTRSFIQENYAKYDAERKRKYLEFHDGTRSYFPTRVPRTVKFKISEKDPNDPYARLFTDDVVDIVDGLVLPRYGLGNYVKPTPHKPPTTEEAKVLSDLSRAGTRLKGFCRTNLFKRLESSGQAFILSVERHILRNFICLHAIENDLPIPIGTQDIGLLDAWANDQDTDLWDAATDNDENNDSTNDPTENMAQVTTEQKFKEQASEIYDTYAKHFQRRFKWLKPEVFNDALAKDLRKDVKALMNVLKKAGGWDPKLDTKLQELLTLLTKSHTKDKVIVFSQFADTVNYLAAQIKAAGLQSMEGVTGDTEDPTAIAHRFSPVSNDKSKQIDSDKELRVVIATDVLSEGQNLQDCSIVVNFDLPWAIIRLIQRAGRVDRIGQKSDTILCYSFLPADGVERIIRLRARVQQRLQENAEVVGADETFFENQDKEQVVRDLFTEKAGILDGDEDTEVDLASYAYQIWKNAIDRNPELAKTIPAMPNVVYSTRPHKPISNQPEGALVYLRTAEGNDALAWIDKNSTSVTESQFAILKAAECTPDTPALLRHKQHHDMVATGVKLIVETEKSVGGQLGRPSGARFRTYERLKAHAEEIKGTLFDTPEMRKAIEDVYRYPLLQSATDTLNRQLKSGIGNQALADLVMSLRADARLCRVAEDVESAEPQVICSLGLRWPTEAPSAKSAEEAAIFTLIFEKDNQAEFTEVEKKTCSEQGYASLIHLLRHVTPNQIPHLEIICEESGPGSYWQEYAVYITAGIAGVITFVGGPANALHILGEALDAAGNVTPYLGQHMSSAGKWFKGAAWRLTPKQPIPSETPKLPGCFGDKQWLDRRTKRCKQCGFLRECVIKIEG